MSHHQIKQILFTAVAAGGVFLVLSEIITEIFGSGICKTEGCRLTVQHVRFGNMPLLLAGLTVFSMLTLFSAINMVLKEKRLDIIINFILIVSLACEGFLTGYQFFRLQRPCTFCLEVFAVFVILGILKILEGQKQIIAGFICMECIFGLFYLILPPLASTRLPEGKKLILFYEQDCPHCNNILKECKQCNIKVCALSALRYQSLLNGLGIKEVPVLIVNDKEEKIILVGKTRIRQYLKSLEARKEILNMKEFSNFLPLNSGDACRIEEKCQ